MKLITTALTLFPIAAVLAAPTAAPRDLPAMNLHAAFCKTIPLHLPFLCTADSPQGGGAAEVQHHPKESTGSMSHDTKAVPDRRRAWWEIDPTANWGPLSTAEDPSEWGTVTDKVPAVVGEPEEKDEKNAGLDEINVADREALKDVKAKVWEEPGIVRSMEPPGNLWRAWANLRAAGLNRREAQHERTSNKNLRNGIYESVYGEALDVLDRAMESVRHWWER